MVVEHFGLLFLGFLLGWWWGHIRMQIRLERLKRDQATRHGND